MIVKTEPSIPKVEEKLSTKGISKQTYTEALDILGEEGYSPKTIILKRRAIPPFGVGIPLKIVADWDAQIEGADALFLLRKSDGDQ